MPATPSGWRRLSPACGRMPRTPPRRDATRPRWPTCGAGRGARRGRGGAGRRTRPRPRAQPPRRGAASLDQRDRAREAFVAALEADPAIRDVAQPRDPGTRGRQPRPGTPIFAEALTLDRQRRRRQGLAGSCRPGSYPIPRSAIQSRRRQSETCHQRVTITLARCLPRGRLLRISPAATASFTRSTTRDARLSGTVLIGTRLAWRNRKGAGR